MLEVGQKIGQDDNGCEKYEVDELYGEGGHAVVFRGHRVSTGDEEVAIKSIRPKYSHDGAFVKRFRREQEQMKEHRDHPNLSPAEDWERLSDGTLWLAMRWIDGDSLEALVESEGPLRPIEAAELIAQAANGLAAVHHKPPYVVHRDLHPGNLMVEDGRAIIIDFGLAKRYDHTSGSPIGPQPGPYNAPELVLGRELTPKSDVYSLGLDLAFALTGVPPSDGRPQFPPNIAVPRSLRRLIRNATSSEPGDRPDAATFAEELHEAAQELRAGRRRRAVAAGWLAAACLVAAVATFLVAQDLSGSAANVHDVSVAGLQLTVPASWKQTTSSARAHALGLDTALRAPAATVLVGTVAPAELPLARGEGGAVSVRLPVGPALRSDQDVPLGADRGYFLRVGDQVVAVLCIAKPSVDALAARRTCDRLGSTIRTDQSVSAISSPSQALRRQVSAALAGYAAASQRGTRRVKAARTQAAARRAAADAADEATAAANRVRAPSLRRLRIALLDAAAAWRSAAHAAAHGHHRAFVHAGARVAAADQTIARARAGLRALGFR